MFRLLRTQQMRDKNDINNNVIIAMIVIMIMIKPYCTINHAKLNNKNTLSILVQPLAYLRQLISQLDKTQ